MSGAAPSRESDPPFDPDVTRIVELDVREILRQGGEPLSQILALLKGLDPAGILHLRTTFHPAPLVKRLAREGWQHRSTQFDAEDWSTWFWRGNAPRGSRTAEQGTTPARTGGVEDLRALSPPEPLLRILRRIEVELHPFDVLLPFRPDPLERILANSDWSMTVIEDRPDGVVVRISPR